MLPTPEWMLGVGYPLSNEASSREMQPIWIRAFELHETAHAWTHGYICDKEGHYKGSINPMSGHKKSSQAGAAYCECFLKAWLELHGGYQYPQCNIPAQFELIDPIPDYIDYEERVV